MQAQSLSGTDLFLSWLADEDKELYALFRQHVSVETYDRQHSCALHLFTDQGFFLPEKQQALHRCWREYCELFNLPVNPDSLQDLTSWTLKKIFDTYSGKFLKFTLEDGTSFFGRFQQFYYSHSAYDPTPPSRTTFLDIIKYPNFYTDEDALSSITDSIVVRQGQIKHIIPVSH